MRYFKRHNNNLRGESDLPSDLIHQRSERLFPPIHLYNTDAREDFIHRAYSFICQDCCLSSGTTRKKLLIPVQQTKQTYLQ